MKLYPYQEVASNYAITKLFERGNSLIVAGTGAGKTIMMAGTIQKFVQGFESEKGRKPHVLVLVHRTEIHAQNHSKFSQVCSNIQTSEITSKRKSLKGFIHFGMVQTVSNLLDEFERANSFFDLIVIDEAHHAKASTYLKIIEWNKQLNPNTKLLGVTATPNRGDELPLIELFDNFYQITSKFLLDSHYLVRPKMIDLTPSFEIRTETTVAQEQGKLNKNLELDVVGLQKLKEMCLQYLDNKEPGKTIIFAPSHNWCKEIYKVLSDMGRNPAYLSNGISSDDRYAELDRFENGDAEELINVDICTEGYDYPNLRNLVDFDTNGTQGQWIQKVGRVLRASPNKTTCTVIDFGGNIALYPNGIETNVNLEGGKEVEKGDKLKPEDLFEEKEEKQAVKKVIHQLDSNEETYTPYHLPKGIESINDSDFGIVYVACGLQNDYIIVPYKDLFNLFVSDKEKLKRVKASTFQDVISYILHYNEPIYNEEPITKTQIRMLSPKYPTMTLTKSAADCFICWNIWKSELLDTLGGVK